LKAPTAFTRVELPTEAGTDKAALVFLESGSVSRLGNALPEIAAA
jgi:hypothetical protein